MNTIRLNAEIKKLNTKQKVELFKKLYAEIANKGKNGDCELAHINTFEKRVLKMLGGAGTVNEETGLPQYFGGGGGGSAPSTQTQFVREAPGIEERKLELMDLARDLIDQPEALPEIQVAPLSQLQQQAIQQAGVTGVGAPTVQAGIGSVLQSQQAPDINQFYNPYQSYVVDEINRQAQIGQQQVADAAIKAGAFGGGREGVQQAEMERRRLETIGRAQQQGFTQALGAAQRQQQMQLGAGTALGQLGVTQQQQALQDINQLMGAGGVQRQLAQATLDATRQSQLQQQYEPYQRIEFLKNVYAAGPTSQSGITASTQPQTSPLAQSIGTGIGAFAAYQGVTGGQKA